MFVLVILYSFVVSRDFLLTHPLIGSTATSGAGSSGIGINDTGLPSRGLYPAQAWSTAPITRADPNQTNIINLSTNTNYETAQASLTRGE